MMLMEYETTMVMRPDISGDVIESTLDRVRDAVRDRGGKLLAINHWGRKKLAYEIMKQSRGVYVHAHYLGGNDLVAELERNLRISDNVLRFLTVQLERNVDAGAFEVKEYEAPRYEEVADQDEGSEDEMEAAGADQPEADAGQPEVSAEQAEASTEAKSADGDNDAQEAKE